MNFIDALHYLYDIPVHGQSKSVLCFLICITILPFYLLDVLRVRVIAFIIFAISLFGTAYFFLKPSPTVVPPLPDNVVAFSHCSEKICYININPSGSDMDPDLLKLKLSLVKGDMPTHETEWAVNDLTLFLRGQIGFRVISVTCQKTQKVCQAFIKLEKPGNIIYRADMGALVSYKENHEDDGDAKIGFERSTPAQ